MCQKDCTDPSCDSTIRYQSKSVELAQLEYKSPALAELRIAYRRGI